MLLAEDHDLVMGAIVGALFAHPLVEVTSVARSLQAAVATLKVDEVDVVVTDLQLGDGLGTELVRVANGLEPPPPVLLMTGIDDRRGIQDALAAGCAGFVSKGQSFDRLVDAIVAVSKGAAVFPAFLLDAVVRPDATGVGATLSKREAEVLQMLAEALSAQEIADALSLSPHTVRNHIGQVLNKLHARSQLEAVIIAARNGLVTIT